MSGSRRFSAHVRVRLDQVPPEAIRRFQLRDGGEGGEIDIIVSTLKKKDKFGNDVTVYMHRHKYEIEEGVPPLYVGRGKVVFDSASGFTRTSSGNNYETEDEEAF